MKMGRQKGLKMAGACNQRPSNGIGHQEMLKVREKIIIDQARDKKHQRDPRAEVTGRESIKWENCPRKDLNSSISTTYFSAVRRGYNLSGICIFTS